MRINKPFFFLLFAMIATCFTFSVAYAQEGFDSQAASQSIKITAEEIAAYWTPERMAKAIPMPLAEVEATEDQLDAETEAAPLGPVFGVDGTVPNQAFDPIPSEEDSADYAPNWGGSPGNWQTSYPGPFQRWTWFGRYVTYPTSTIGKMFFTQDGVNYVCSGAVINAGSGQKDVISTAGHCVNRGSTGGTNNGWSYNVQFCPSYTPAGAPRGCWPAVNLWAFTAWTTYGHIEADTACIVARNYGTVYNNHIGDVTGTLGWAVNTGYQQPFISLGYPQESPMNYRNGGLIVIASGPGWYTYNWGGTDVDGSQLYDSMYMGNDMTGGSSGGPWVLGWEHRSEAYPDTDNSNSTDPYPGGATQARIVGNNSHKIVSGGVLRTQEMGSAQYRSSSPDTDGLWGTCQADANGS
jgi:hypothetical protein